MCKIKVTRYCGRKYSKLKIKKLSVGSKRPKESFVFCITFCAYTASTELVDRTDEDRYTGRVKDRVDEGPVKYQLDRFLWRLC